MYKLKLSHIATIFTLLFIILNYIYYQHTREVAINNAKVKIEELLLNYKSFRAYIGQQQKQEIYKLQKQKIIDKEYFNPTLLSSTYGAKNVNNLYNQFRKQNGQAPVVLRFASDNPRNIKNKATKKESQILKKFNNNEMSQYIEIINTNDGKSLYYAVKTKKITKRCMRCHSDPKLAPKGLIKIYGDKNGFYDKIGKIRAILSATYPLDKDLEVSNKTYFYYSFITFAIFSILFFLIYNFSRNITLKNKILKEKDDKLLLLNKDLEIKIEDALRKNTKQHQLLQHQSKLASMGEMIGSIAHQWRQPLNELGINIQKLKYNYINNEIDEEFIKKFIGKNKQLINFMSDTIDDFRNFFRIEKETESFSVKKTIEDTISMQSAELKNSNIILNITEDDFKIHSFKNEFKQVILNLINNAKDALIENKIDNPTIDIILGNTTVIIKDNAGGIPENLINRIYEPYFTTKEQGKGTGMGLYMSKIIIEDNMGGTLSALNIDNGTQFTIKLKKAKNESIIKI